jgi:hypothetical protein
MVVTKYEEPEGMRKEKSSVWNVGMRRKTELLRCSHVCKNSNHYLRRNNQSIRSIKKSNQSTKFQVDSRKSCPQLHSKAVALLLGCPTFSFLLRLLNKSLLSHLGKLNSLPTHSFS